MISIKNILNSIFFLLILICCFSCKNDDDAVQTMTDNSQEIEQEMNDAFTPFIGQYKDIAVQNIVFSTQDSITTDTSTFFKNNLTITRTDDNIQIDSFWVNEDEAISVENFAQENESGLIKYAQGAYSYVFYQMNINEDTLTIQRDSSFTVFDNPDFLVEYTSILTAIQSN